MKELQSTPIPPKALQAALDALIDRGVIEITHPSNRGHQWLAERSGVGDRTVRRWISGETPIAGGIAALVRLVLEPYF